MIEQLLEYQQRISLNFIDFVKAFDSVHRERLWKIARAYGISSQFTDIFLNLYKGSCCCIQMEEGVTDFFTIETDVRQGCVFSPMLFLLVIDFVGHHSIDCADSDLWVRNLEDDGSHHSKVGRFPSPMSSMYPQDHLLGPCYERGSIPSRRYTAPLCDSHRMPFSFRQTRLMPPRPPATQDGDTLAACTRPVCSSHWK